MRPPYFRPYGAQAFTRAVSASARTSVPRFWRIYLALWLIRRWRLPATPCLILPVAVSLKRFLTPLLVLSLGIFVSLVCSRLRDDFEPPRQPTLAGPFAFPSSWKGRAYRGARRLRQGHSRRSAASRIRRPKIMQPTTKIAAAAKNPATITAGHRSHAVGISQAAYVRPQS